jgi:Family of unknown function (DUF6714)
MNGMHSNNSMSEEGVSALEGELERAFGHLPLPKSDGIVYDNSGEHLECNQVRAKYSGRHWRDLSIEDIIEEPDALAFFTDEAFRFYLPAFIRASLRDPERADLIPYHVLSSLARPADREWWQEHGRSVFRSRTSSWDFRGSYRRSLTDRCTRAGCRARGKSRSVHGKPKECCQKLCFFPEEAP